MVEIEKMDVKEAVDTLTKALKEDPEYYYAWQANIAMSFVDEFKKQSKTVEPGLHFIANQAAIHFLDLLMRSSGE